MGSCERSAAAADKRSPGRGSRYFHFMTCWVAVDTSLGEPRFIVNCNTWTTFRLRSLLTAATFGGKDLPRPGRIPPLLRERILADPVSAWRKAF